MNQQNQQTRPLSPQQQQAENAKPKAETRIVREFVQPVSPVLRFSPTACVNASRRAWRWTGPT